MTTMTRHVATPVSRPVPGRLVKAELLKIWTTNSWWIFGDHRARHHRLWRC